MHDDDITPDDYFPVDELKIGRTNCDWDGLMDYRTRLDGYSWERLSAVVGNPLPNKSADLVTRFRSGFAYKQNSSLHCNYANTECWYVRVHPKIESISATTGSTAGG